MDSEVEVFATHPDASDVYKSLATSPGGEWLTDVGRQIEDKIPKINSMEELNAYVLGEVQKFLTSDQGLQLSDRLQLELSQGALMVPVYLAEEMIKLRVKTVLLSNVKSIGLMIAWRLPICCAVVYGTKLLIRRVFRGKSYAPAIRAALDVAFPTETCAAVLAVVSAIKKLL